MFRPVMDHHQAHSFCSLSYESSIPSSKTSSPHNAIQCFLFQFPVPSPSLRPSSSGLRLILPLSATYILSSLFLPVTCFRRQFLRSMRPIQLAFLLFLVYRIFLSSSAPCNSSSFLTRSVQMTSSNLLHHHISRISRYGRPAFRSVQVSASCKAMPPMYHFTSVFPLNFKSNFLVKRAFFLSAGCTMKIQFV